MTHGGFRGDDELWGHEYVGGGARGEEGDPTRKRVVDVDGMGVAVSAGCLQVHSLYHPRKGDPHVQEVEQVLARLLVQKRHLMKKQKLKS